MSKPPLRELEPTAYEKLRIFEQVAIHALPYRRAGAAIVKLLARNQEMAWKRGYARPFLAHMNLAHRRGRQHRNTSRNFVNELAAMGFIRLEKARNGRGYFFSIRWASVFRFANRQGVGVMRRGAMDAEGLAPKSEQEYRELQAKRQHRAKQPKANASPAERAAIARENLATPEQRRQGIAALRAAMRTPLKK